MQGDLDQYSFFVARSLFYLWLAFIFAAPVALLLVRPSIENRRTRSIAVYLAATICWLLFFYLVLPGLLAGYRFGAAFAAVLLALSPWVLSWLVFLSVRPGNPVGSMRKDDSGHPETSH